MWTVTAPHDRSARRFVNDAHSTVGLPRPNGQAVCNATEQLPVNTTASAVSGTREMVMAPGGCGHCLAPLGYGNDRTYPLCTCLDQDCPLARSVGGGPV